MRGRTGCGRGWRRRSGRRGGDVVTAVVDAELVARAVDRDRRVFVDLPPAWVVNVGPPAVAGPVDWGGVAPAVAVGFEADSLRGDALAAGVVAAALERLGDPVVVD